MGGFRGSMALVDGTRNHLPPRVSDILFPSRRVPMGTNEAVIREVIGAWESGTASGQAAIRKHFAHDCRWEQVGIPITTGPEEAAELIGSMEQMGFIGVTVEYRGVASAGNVVFTERVDWLLRPDGTRVGPLPVVGVTEFRDGKISAWREYYDSRNLDLLTAQ
jgi:limonene-1,2-epoxide hydrolase